jgi:hypothetical protein
MQRERRREKTDAILALVILALLAIVAVIGVTAATLSNVKDARHTVDGVSEAIHACDKKLERVTRHILSSIDAVNVMCTQTVASLPGSSPACITTFPTSDPAFAPDLQPCCGGTCYDARVAVCRSNIVVPLNTLLGNPLICPGLIPQYCFCFQGGPFTPDLGLCCPLVGSPPMQQHQITLPNGQLSCVPPVFNVTKRE